MRLLLEADHHVTIDRGPNQHHTVDPGAGYHGTIDHGTIAHDNHPRQRWRRLLLITDERMLINQRARRSGTESPALALGGPLPPATAASLSPAPAASLSPTPPSAPPSYDAGMGRGATRTSAWLGVLTLAGVAAWLGWIGLRVLYQAGDLSNALATARGHMIGPALIIMVAAILLAERRWPAVQRPLLARAHLVDAGYLALFAVIVVPILTFVETGFAIEVDRHARFLLLERLPLAPRVILVGVILVGTDAMNWLAHVANHRSAALWRLHALHHSQEDMSVLTTFRTHPLVHASYLPALLPALVLGASGTLPGAALIGYGCLVTLPHANLRWTFGPLGRVFVSPAYHRLHHASVPIDGRGAVNFGFVLVGWDQLGRRAAFPTGRAPIATGIAGRPVPVEQSARASGVGRVVLAQLAQPFRLRAATDS
jgi:sterol desaturase/sphingolipid hydroxylase (fatty acid hydroxylase superfamily)